MEQSTTLLEVRNLKKYYPLARKGLTFGPVEKVHAVDDVSFSITKGETLSLVGESGCGKSTVGRTIARLVDVTDGQILLGGVRMDTARGKELHAMRRHVQMIFQDPFSSLDPRMRAGDIVAQPLRNFQLSSSRAALRTEVARLLALVGLPADAASRFPHEFSGGQRQRIAIARALAPGADLIICDEAVSALDVSVKAQIVNLLVDLQERLGLTLLFISHDLAIVEHLTHRVAVMYLGKIVEIADRRQIFLTPRHPYTKALLAAVPVPDPAVERQAGIALGEIPSATHPPSGCRFRTRCSMAIERCTLEVPALLPRDAGHSVACHLVG